jgi:hypothetical protein
VRPADMHRALCEGEDELGQVLALLAADGVEHPEGLAMGDGDRRLLAVLRAITGHDLELAVACATCGTVNEATIDPDALPPVRPRCALLDGGGLRPPEYGDLIGLPAEAGEREGALLRRCTVGTPRRPPLPEDVELVDDSLAGPVLLECVECGAALEAPHDVQHAALATLWADVEAAAVEVHLLARAYHWPLADIEALPTARRMRLAELVAEGR